MNTKNTEKKDLSRMWILPCKSYADANQKNFESYFNYLIDSYLDTVTSFKFLDDNYINRLRKICSSLKETINTYLNGFPGEAYILFKSLMDDVKNDFLKLSSITYTDSQLKEVEIKMNSFVDIEKSKMEDIKTIFNEVLEYSHDPQPIEYLYRIRSTNKISPTSTKFDLFHRSFKDYKHINNYRFSIPGYPCLYLGSTFEVYYKECQEPKLEDIWLMRSHVNKPIKFIDLTKTPRRLLKIFYELAKGSKEIENIIKNSVIDIVNDIAMYNRDDRRNRLKKLNINNQIFNSLKKSIEQKESSTKQCIEFAQKSIKKLSKADNEALVIATDFHKFIELLNCYTQVTSRIIEYIKILIILYPIQIASSIKKVENSIFTPEYIIPQLLMQWLRKNSEFYGVKYNSTQCNITSSNNNFNLAIPARDNTKPYCKELLEIFTLDEPVHVISKIGFQSLIKEISNSFIKNDFTSFYNKSLTEN